MHPCLLLIQSVIFLRVRRLFSTESLCARFNFFKLFIVKVTCPAHSLASASIRLTFIYKNFGFESRRTEVKHTKVVLIRWIMLRNASVSNKLITVTNLSTLHPSRGFNLNKIWTTNMTTNDWILIDEKLTTCNYSLTIIYISFSCPFFTK